MKEKLILIGGGGHCKSCIDVIEAADRFEIAGIVDKKDKLNDKVLDCKIIAVDDDIPELVKDYRYFLITIGQIKSPALRIDKYQFLKNHNVIFPVITAPTAYISKYAVIGEGTIIMHNAFVNADAAIGNNCIINTGALIEHDVFIANHCHISTGCIINGGSSVGDGTFIGSNSVIINNINIPGNTVIGAGSIVVKSFTEKGIYTGIPARRIG